MTANVCLKDYASRQLDPNEIEDSSRIIIIGGRGCGKTTFARKVIERWHTKHNNCVGFLVTPPTCSLVPEYANLFSTLLLVFNECNAALDTSISNYYNNKDKDYQCILVVDGVDVRRQDLLDMTTKYKNMHMILMSPYPPSELLHTFVPIDFVIICGAGQNDSTIKKYYRNYIGPKGGCGGMAEDEFVRLFKMVVTGFNKLVIQPRTGNVFCQPAYVDAHLV